MQRCDHPLTQLDNHLLIFQLKKSRENINGTEIIERYVHVSKTILVHYQIYQTLSVLMNFIRKIVLKRFFYSTDNIKITVCNDLQRSLILKTVPSKQNNIIMRIMALNLTISSLAHLISQLHCNKKKNFNFQKNDTANYIIGIYSVQADVMLREFYYHFLQCSIPVDTM